MPCAGPSDSECRGADAKVAVSKHIVFFLTEMGMKKDIPVEATNNIKDGGWGRNGGGIDELTKFLCKEIQEASVHDAHAIIYNARSRKARELANWWEDHQKLDEERAAKKAKKAGKAALAEEREEILNSLTDHQRAVLFPGD